MQVGAHTNAYLVCRVFVVSATGSLVFLNHVKFREL